MDFKPYLDKKIELTVYHFTYTRHHVGRLLSCSNRTLCIESVYSKKKIWISKPGNMKFDIKILEEEKK